jgi:hypothetical protein
MWTVVKVATTSFLHYRSSSYLQHRLIKLTLK